LQSFTSNKTIAHPDHEPWKPLVVGRVAPRAPRLPTRSSFYHKTAPCQPWRLMGRDSSLSRTPFAYSAVELHFAPCSVLHRVKVSQSQSKLIKVKKYFPPRLQPTQVGPTKSNQIKPPRAQGCLFGPTIRASVPSTYANLVPSHRQDAETTSPSPRGRGQG
jgi:hypothetical protein